MSLCPICNRDLNIYNSVKSEFSHLYDWGDVPLKEHIEKMMALCNFCCLMIDYVNNIYNYNNIIYSKLEFKKLLKVRAFI